jgi:hypothetical protein
LAVEPEGAVIDRDLTLADESPAEPMYGGPANFGRRVGAAVDGD